jgi:hypothetical protein
MIEKYFDKFMKRMNIFLNVWRVFLTPFLNSRRKRFAGNPQVSLVSGQAGACHTKLSEFCPTRAQTCPPGVRNRQPLAFSRSKRFRDLLSESLRMSHGERMEQPKTCYNARKRRLSSCENQREGNTIKSELERIPGIGKNMAEHLIDIGYTSIESLKGQDPEKIYLRDCSYQGRKVDRCVLYVYRLAVYYAENDTREPGKLKWWNWKD